MNNILELKSIDVINTSNNKKILNNISLTIRENKILGIVGESGSGKSILAKTIMGLLPDIMIANGNILYMSNIQLGSKKSYKKIRGNEISIIFQNGYEAFNPIKKIQDHFDEIFAELKEKEKIQDGIEKSLYEVNLNPANFYLSRYPHQLSGGQLQRLMLAMSMLQQPSLLIADEPTTALDPLTQLSIIKILKNFSKIKKCSMIFISHDLGLVEYMADEILVLKNGEIVEYASVEEITKIPSHSYTKSLVKAHKTISEKFNKTFKNARNY